MPDKKAKGGEEQEVIDALARGDSLPAGWSYNAFRDPPIQKVSELEERVAKGEVSVSIDGRVVTDLATGESHLSDQPIKFAQGAAPPTAYSANAATRIMTSPTHGAESASAAGRATGGGAGAGAGAAGGTAGRGATP